MAVKFSFPRQIQFGGGLIQNQDRRFQRENARENEALSLTAGKGCGFPLFHAIKPHIGESLLHTGTDLFTGELQIGHAESHLIFNGDADDLILGLLKHKADGFTDLRQWNFLLIFAADRHGTVEISFVKFRRRPGKGVEKHTFARSRRPGHGHEFAFPHRKVNIVKNRLFRRRKGQTFQIQFNDRFHNASKMLQNAL